MWEAASRSSLVQSGTGRTRLRGLRAFCAWSHVPRDASRGGRLSHPASGPLQQGDATVIGLLGVGFCIVGTGLFVVFSLTRYFRYWLVRLIYEQREQTDQLRPRS